MNAPKQIAAELHPELAALEDSQKVRVVEFLAGHLKGFAGFRHNVSYRDITNALREAVKFSQQEKPKA